MFPELRKKLTTIADHVFATYDFDYLMVTDDSNWIISYYDDLYCFQKDCSTLDQKDEHIKISFKVRIDAHGFVVDAIALDRDGDEIGFWRS